MTFADITIVPVSRDREATYLAFSRRMAQVYREHGASKIVDYWQTSEPVSQDDFHADGTAYEPGELVSFAGLTGASSAEAIVVTVTEWPSREARDRGVAAATADPRVVATLEEDPVFDGSRLIAGSFHLAAGLPVEDPPES